jgi:hypothetical protein
MGMAGPLKDNRYEVLEGIFDLAMSQEIVDIVFAVHGVLDSMEKTAAWMITKNLNLGGCSPMALILAGRGHKVLKFIQSVEEESMAEEERKPLP